MLLEYSPYFAQYLNTKKVTLYGLTDQPFLKQAFNVMRSELGITIPMTVSQFLSDGFLERKIILVVELIQQVRFRHEVSVQQFSFSVCLWMLSKMLGYPQNSSLAVTLMKGS